MSGVGIGLVTWTHPRHTLPSKFLLFSVIISETRHGGIIALAHIQLVAVGKAAHARSPPCTSTSAFAVSRKRVSSRKLPVTFRTNVRLFTSVEFAMALEVM
jgi:hypothetical protein